MIPVAVLAAAIAGHTGIPQSLSITLRPDTDDVVLVSTTFGAVLSNDRGATWRNICEEAIGYGTGQRPAWWLSASGAMFAGSFKGLFVARTGGCAWQSVPDFDETGASDIQSVGATILATSNKYGVVNRILRSVDDGLTWTPSPEKSDVLFYSSVRFAPSNPMRVYAGAWWFSPFTSILLRSDDNGQTYTRKDLSAALPAAGAFYVLGVHPTKPEVVFATVIRDAEPHAAWLLKSVDSGETFAPVVTTTELFGSVAFGMDPTVVYAASGNELWKSIDEGQTFTKRDSPKKNACVTTRGTSVFSCGLQELDGWAAGQGPNGDFGPLLRWYGIAGPLTCPVGSVVQTLCEPVWPVVKATFPPEADAGVPPTDAGTIDGGTEPPPAPRPCGCSAAVGPLAVGAVAFLRRRRQSN